MNSKRDKEMEQKPSQPPQSVVMAQEQLDEIWKNWMAMSKMFESSFSSIYQTVAPPKQVVPEVTTDFLDDLKHLQELSKESTEALVNLNRFSTEMALKAFSTAMATFKPKQ